jgi:hypothetical protein
MTAKVGRWRFLGLLVILGLLVSLGGLAVARSSIRIITPRTGAALHGSVVVQVDATAPEISYIILGIDKERTCSTNARPYNFTLDTAELSDGYHVLFAEAYSRAGLLGRTSGVKVLVKNAVAKPARAIPVSRKVEVPVVKAPKPQEAPRDLGSAALISRAVGKTLQSEAQPQALTAEPRVNPEALSLPAAQISVARPATTKPLSVVALITAHPSTAQAGPRVNAEALSLPAPQVSAARPVQKAAAGKAATAAKPSVLVNGKPLDAAALAALIDSGFEVGFRGVMTRAGWRVEWIPAKRIGVATVRGHRIEVVPNSSQALVDGTPKSMGRKAHIENNRLIVALRPLCQAANIRIDWDPTTRIARLIIPEQQTDELAALR